MRWSKVFCSLTCLDKFASVVHIESEHGQPIQKAEHLAQKTAQHRCPQCDKELPKDEPIEEAVL